MNRFENLLFDPVIPWPVMILIAIVLLGGIGWSLFYGLRSKWRIGFLWLMRAVALAAFLAILTMPQKRTDEVTILRPQLVVLVDGSESMTDPADEKQPKRADKVRDWFKTPELAKLRKDFDVRVFSFAQTINELPPNSTDVKFDGDRSNLIGALQQVQDRFRGQPLAAMMLFSDGLDTTGTKWEDLPGAKIPIFAFELERPFTPKARPKHISIAGVDHPARVVIGWETEIKISVAGSGLSGKTIGLELWRDGEKRNETTVAFNEEEQTRDTAFVVTHDKAGTYQYDVRVTDPAADEDAKRHPFLIEVVEPGKRVLYVQNALGFEFKFLRRALVGDRNLQVSSYVRGADNRLVAFDERGAGGKAVPLDFASTSLSKYSVIVIGDLPLDSVTPQELNAIQEFVKNGGGLVLLGGPNTLGSDQIEKTPLRDLLPVRFSANTGYQEGKFSVSITESGLRHPVFGTLFAKISDFPPLLTVNLCGAPAPLAEVLIESDVHGRKYPMVAATRFGQGRVVTVLSDTIWRWRLAQKGWAAEKSPYDTFWAQLMDWLIPKEQDKKLQNRIELFTERQSFILGEKPEVRAIVTTETGTKAPASVPLQVKTPDGKKFEYVMQPASLTTGGGRTVPGFRVEVEPNVAGVFQAVGTVSFGGTNIEAQTKFVVNKPLSETTGKPINRDLLKHVAEASQGKFCGIDDWGSWSKNLHYEEQHFSRVQLTDLWNHPILLTILLAALAADWLARKLWSLP